MGFAVLAPMILNLLALLLGTQLMVVVLLIFAFKGSVSLLQISVSLNAKFIFLSSQAAQEKSISDYGLTKWHIEKDVLASNGFVIRVGQVYGGKLDGLFGVLSSIVKKHHILPFFIL